MTPADPLDHASHDLDELSEALDDRLPEGRQRQVLDRVRACSGCRAAYEAMADARAQARRLPAVEAPEELEVEVRSRLREGFSRPASPLRRYLALAAAAALLLATAALLTRRPTSAQLLTERVAADYRALSTGRSSLGFATREAARLEAWFKEAPLGFPVRVFDLAMMGYALRGGAVGRTGSRPIALFVYRERATGRDVLCAMLRAARWDLPPAQETREHDGIGFRIYRVEGLTLVFWREGEVLCALAGDGDAEALLQLAFAKAMKARTQATRGGPTQARGWYWS